jgi:hypothetical protein
MADTGERTGAAGIGVLYSQHPFSWGTAPCRAEFSKIIPNLSGNRNTRFKGVVTVPAAAIPLPKSSTFRRPSPPPQTRVSNDTSLKPFFICTRTRSVINALQQFLHQSRLRNCRYALIESKTTISRINPKAFVHLNYTLINIDCYKV